jgi:hypothetical protein
MTNHSAACERRHYVSNGGDSRLESSARLPLVVRSLVPLVNGGFGARPVLGFFLYNGRPVVTGLTLLDHRSAIPLPISVLRRLTNAYTTLNG